MKKCNQIFKIPERIKELKLSEVYTFLKLRKHSDFRTDISHVRQSTLSNGRSTSTVKRHIKRFIELGLVTKEYRGVKGLKGYFRVNSYKIDTTHYDEVDLGRLLNSGLDTRLISFLVLFKACCVNSTNRCYWTISELCSRLNICRPYIIALLKCAIRNGLIRCKDGYYCLVENGIFRKSRHSAYREYQLTYDLVEYCIDDAALYKIYKATDESGHIDLSEARSVLCKRYSAEENENATMLLLGELYKGSGITGAEVIESFREGYGIPL